MPCVILSLGSQEKVPRLAPLKMDQSTTNTELMVTTRNQDGYFNHENILWTLTVSGQSNN